MRNTKLGSTGSSAKNTENQKVDGIALKNYKGKTLKKMNRFFPSHLQIAPIFKLTLSVPS
jgi:hypothetical protein